MCRLLDFRKFGHLKAATSMWFSQSFSDHDHISATEMSKTDFNTLLGRHVDNVDIGSLRFRYSGTGDEGHENHEGGSRWNVRR